MHQYVTLVVVLLAIVPAIFGISLDMPDNMKKAAQLLHDHCVGATGVDEALIEASRGGNLPDDPNLKCYVHCLFETAGLIHRDTGKIRFDEVSHLFPQAHQEIIEKITQKCDTIHGSDQCDTAYLTLKCYFDEDPANSKLI